MTASTSHQLYDIDVAQTSNIGVFGANMNTFMTFNNSNKLNNLFWLTHSVLDTLEYLNLFIIRNFKACPICQRYPKMMPNGTIYPKFNHFCESESINPKKPFSCFSLRRSTWSWSSSSFSRTSSSPPTRPWTSTTPVAALKPLTGTSKRPLMANWATH